jgi:anti-anti-sigma regulatory factor
MAPLPHFERLLVEEVGGVVAVTFKDNALSDGHALAATREELALLAGARPGANVVVDVGKAERLSSPVLALLIGLHRKLHNGGGTLRLRGLPPTFNDLWPGMGD